MDKKLIIVDGNSLINRAYYGVQFLATKNGEPVNAVYGFLNMLFKIITVQDPTHLVITFDVKAPTFRKELYPEYKAGRHAPDPNLISQFPILKEILDAMNIYRIELPGWEADDLIGTIAKKFNGKTHIVTADADSFQLIQDDVTVLRTLKGFSDVEEYDVEHLFEVEGLTPKQIIDFKALSGDSSDNIPGAPGVGPKTARKLLSEYSNLDNIYANLDHIKENLRNKLIENKEIVYLSYKLATIDCNAPIEYDENEFIFKTKVTDSLVETLVKYELKTILRKSYEIFNKSDSISECYETQESAEESMSVGELVIIDNEDYFKDILNKNSSSKKIAFYSDNTNIQFAFNKDLNYKLKIKEGIIDNGLDLSSSLLYFSEFISKNNIKLILYNAKSVMYYFKNINIDFDITNFDDIQIMYYLIDTNKKNDLLENVIEYQDDLIATNILYNTTKFQNKLDELDLNKVYNEIEKPLVKVLYDMENVGFKIDKNTLATLSKYFDEELEILTKKIYDLAGSSFNINSPKQLGKVLFEDLNLPCKKQTKTGYSTNVEVLESLYNKHDIIKYILNYRDSKKLSSTYIEPVKDMLDSNSRIHTSFKQTMTSTGRLSSIEPNLQNIPIRKKEGREIRRMFVASENCKLVCADYSQIELRLLAHLSGDVNLIKAYNEGRDIHAITASKIFNVPLDAVNPDMRRQAKAVNFGIIYGISSFGLSQDIGTSMAEAKRFINAYFKTYPTVKEYIDNNVVIAKKNGYIRSLSGRIRYIPELYASKMFQRQFGERIAMNMPLQGSASDIIKMAMIRVYSELKKGNFKAKMILQVHDELIIDCPNEEVDAVSKILNESMENIVELKVPLIAEVKVGDSWYATK